MSATQLSQSIEAGIATLTLNRPEALNAITPEMIEGLAAALEALEHDQQVRAVVITGAGRAFSAGVDLKAFGDRPVVNGSVGDILDLPGQRATDAMRRMRKPVVGKVNGHCFTGALELVLACDLVYVAAEAKLGDTHAKWGLRPSWGMSQALPRRIGQMAARELSFTARTFSGAEAEQLGLANACVPAAELDNYVASVLSSIVANSAGVLAAYKDLYAQAEELGFAAALRYEYDTEFEIGDSNERLVEFLK